MVSHKNAHRLAWVDVWQVCFEFLNGPVLVAVDGLVTVFLVGSPDDQNNRTVYETLFHDSKTLDLALPRWAWLLDFKHLI